MAQLSPNLFSVCSIKKSDRADGSLQTSGIFCNLQIKKSGHFVTTHILQEGLGNSSAMEVFALKSLLTFFTQKCGINVRVLVTDRSTSVRAMLKDNFPDINHQFDIWYEMKISKCFKKCFRHFVKSIKTKLFKASKLKSCLDLKIWIDSIVNMIWWSLATCKGELHYY